MRRMPKLTFSMKIVTKKVKIPDNTDIFYIFANKTSYSISIMDTGKIERAAVRAVEEYIDKCPKLVPNIFTNDKTPFWDGDIFVYNGKEKRNENFFVKIPIQVKGTINTKDKFYRIGREHLIGYKTERGTLFFLVQEDDYSKRIKILYNMLSSETLDTLLQKGTKTIAISLNEIPKNPNDFENEIFEFARKRNGTERDNPATREIKSLVSEFEQVEKHFKEIENKSARYELESLLNIIKKLKDDGTLGWRDRFVYYSQKFIKLAIDNIKDNTFINLQSAFGIYLYEQKQYHLVEGYFVNALKSIRKLVKENPAIHMVYMATTLNNLANLHTILNRLDKAEDEFNEALDIYRKLEKDNPDAYIGDLAGTLNNLANLHSKLNRLGKAEDEYKEALDIYRKLTKESPNTCKDKVAMTLNNLANLHSKLNRLDKAEDEFNEALDIYRKLTKESPNTYKDKVAMTLNNLASLHSKLNRLDKAEVEFNEALDIYRKLEKDNPEAYIGDLAGTLNNLASLHSKLNRLGKAEDEFKEALDIYRKLEKDNPDAYIRSVVGILSNLANLHSKLNRPAEDEFKEALEIYRKLAKENPEVYIGDLAGILYNVACFHFKLNRLDKAEDEFKEALEIYRMLAKDNPRGYMAYVVDILSHLSILFLKYDKRKDKAKQACEEALGIYKEISEESQHGCKLDVDSQQKLDISKIQLDIIKLILYIESR